MKGKVLLVVVGALLVVGGVYWWSAQEAKAPTGDAPEAYSWQFVDKTADQSQPKTQVSFVANGKARVVGTYDGSCAEQDSDLLPNEKSKVVCWFAGGGNEIGLFEEGGVWSVRVGDLDEGSVEVDGFRGNFKTVISF